MYVCSTWVEAAPELVSSPAKGAGKWRKPDSCKVFGAILTTEPVEPALGSGRETGRRESQHLRPSSRSGLLGKSGPTSLSPSAEDLWK